MSSLIPTTQVDEQDRPIVDATRHNAAVRLATGKFQIIRRLTSAPLILLFLLAPWLTINGAPILWMDLDHHVLHLFGIVFWPDDLLILTWVAMASAFGLFAAANIAGRVWCGFSCPQTVWSMMFIWVEEKTQGSRNKRLKEMGKPLLTRNWLPLILKHSIWLLLAFVTGFTFVAYFETGFGLWQQIITANVQSEVIFWLGFFSILTYINAGWLREQVCLHMCPYARFQSVMVDKQTLKVNYNNTRGEPRKHNNAHPLSNKQGDCIDCQLCVQVCPVGIDIRQGLQYACIDCGACIDACDDIMTSINKPIGLIDFSDGNPVTAKRPFNLRNWLPKQRPRLWGYLAACLVAMVLFTAQVILKDGFEFHLSRDRGPLYFYHQLNISNAFTLNIQNRTTEKSSFTLESTHPHLIVANTDTLSVLSGQKNSVSIRIDCNTDCPIKGKSPFQINVLHQGKIEAKLEGTFFAP